ncbi:MAG: DsbC family protein [Desulfuromonadaceae bacterium]|nr:DsbC family protein [Desulfuromonadaceae bacterium]
MFKILCIVVAVIISAVSSAHAMPQNGCGGECASCHNLSIKDADALLKKTGITVKSVKQAPAKGLFELLVEKNDKQGVIFIDYGKKHLLQGMIVDLETLQPVSALPQPKQVTSVDVKTIPVANAVVLGNPKGTKKLYVFTDPDCPYCRKGHSELKKLIKIDPDVTIYVMLFPLPMHPGSYDKSRAILESKNHELLDKAFEGKEIPKPVKESSKKAIDEIVKFGNTHGISGTPTLILPDGTIQVGMRDAETLKKELEGK